MDKSRDEAIRGACTAGNLSSTACGNLIAPAQKALDGYGENVAYNLLYKDVYRVDAANAEAVLRGLDADSILRDIVITDLASRSEKTRAEVEQQYDFVMTMHAITVAMAGGYGLKGLTSGVKVPASTLITGETKVVGAKDAASRNANATSMLTDSEAAALVERNVIEGTAKGAAPKVAAEGKVGGQTFQDVNQTSRPLNEADPKIPSLITDRIADKAATNPGKLYPNGNMKDAHAEIGVIQQAYSSGKTAGADMSMTVAGKDVCGFCKGDIAAAAEKAELKSLTVRAIDDKTGLPKNYYWESGMKSIKEKK
ncbi:cytidine deaminase-like fold-containing protein [Pseudomonas sp. EA_35y_Pfl1_P108]|uniref:cytidine deaminase-like fold-containing protein n=2 Tax=unclassified Pseudomonas TaxID=196821 RepID=UPI0030D96AA9